MIKLKVQLNNFAYEYGVIMTLNQGNSDNYFIIRNSATGRLTNTHHRLNIDDGSEIN
jgi:hypothetical protein